LHQALLNLPGFGEFGFQLRNFRVHVIQNSSDSILFVDSQKDYSGRLPGQPAGECFPSVSCRVFPEFSAKTSFEREWLRRRGPDRSGFGFVGFSGT